MTQGLMVQIRCGLVLAVIGAGMGLVSGGCVGTVLPGIEGDPGGSTADPGGDGTGTGSGAMSPGAGSGSGGSAPGGGAGGSSNPAVAPATFTCNQNATAAVQPWRKLTATQYRNTLRDLLTFVLRDAAGATTVLNGLTGSLGRLPPDERQILPQDLHGSYRRLDQATEQLYVDVTYDVAVAAAANLTSAARLGTVVGACATDGMPANDGDCLTAFIQKLGERALRRPLAADEVAFYRGIYGATPGVDPAGLADVIASLLTAPQFLYHVEHGDAAVAGKAGTFKVGAYELANRLSYQFWDTMPDDALFAAARSGALATSDGFARELDRVFKDPRTRASMDDFFRDWLKLEDLKPLEARNADPVFKTFAAADLPTATLRTQMIDDALALVRHFTWDVPGTFDDLLSTDQAFPRGAELAKLYGVPAWSGTGAAPSFPAGTRPGLLTRAAFLATGSANTRPVMKGVFVRETMLCDQLPAAPDGVAANPPDLDGKLSTRQVVEGLTERAGTACTTCHASLINPIGFATEGFDALGRQRTDQRLFDTAGREVGRAPVNTRSIPQITAGDMTPSNGPADLMRLMGGSGKAHACFARQYVRFTFARWENVSTDGCLLEGLRKPLASKGSLADVLKAVALAPEFQQRSFQ
jgi:hypothetical protein